jgi:two-component system response regulator MtrA
MAENQTILIVDDEINLSRSLGLILQRAGYIVSTAETAEQALQLLHAGAFDLVFLDIKLPDQSGIQLLPRIRDLYPDMPVLILTARATLETAIESVRAGARDYLLKPIDPENILSRVNQLLSEQKQPKRRREITTQLQSLLNELVYIDGEAASPSTNGATTPVNDPARFLKTGPLVIDRHTHSVIINERSISLPPSTFHYLVTLVRHSPDPVSHEKLVLESQGYQHLSRAEAREITRWQMHELRRLVEHDPRHPQMVITVRDIGYRLVV